VSSRWAASVALNLGQHRDGVPVGRVLDPAELHEDEGARALRATRQHCDQLRARLEAIAPLQRERLSLLSVRQESLGEEDTMS
jgi:crotonobetainyl-CoA:carnitine CoA-transferase CaiB-like acyl-CoA transferase